MRHIKNLTKSELIQLRNEITLNSVFLRDYSNTLGIDENEAYYFFCGYLSYLEILADEENWCDLDIYDLVERFDNPRNLKIYRDYIEAF